MIKNTLSFLLLSWFSLSIPAQTINWAKSGTNIKTDSIAKTIVGPAQYVITYNYNFVRDAKNLNDKRTGITVLQIGNNYNRFCDFSELRFDSICDEVARGRISVIEASPLMLSALKNSRFTESILINKQTKKETIQRTAGLKTNRYQYIEDCPVLKWEMLEGDTIIEGYKCNKAMTSLFGRDYVAWYAPEVNMPFGPYKFNGLPGLIFRVTDTQGHFDFILNGLKKTNQYTPIYMWSNKDIIKTNRKTVRQIYKNYCIDPLAALTNENIQVSDEVKATVNSKPYNPIELE